MAFRGGSRIWHHVDVARLWLRPFTDAFLDRYLAAAGDDVLGCVGAYQLEGLGAQLMARVEGDYFTILGLPLLPLLQFLRDQGVLEAMIMLGPHRLDRHGQEPCGCHLPRLRRAGVRRRRARCMRCSPPAARRWRRWRRLSRAAWTLAGGIDRGGWAARCWGGRTSCGGSRPSCTRWCARAEAALPAPGLPGGRRPRRARHSAAAGDRRSERRVDAVALVWASPMLQAQRALRRPGMTAEKLAQIRRAQLPDAYKRKRADFVIPSGYDRGATALHVRQTILAVLQRPPRAWPMLWANRAGAAKPA